MGKLTLGINAGFVSASTDVDVKSPFKKLKKYLDEKKAEKEENKIQDITIGFWLQETGACVEMATVHCSRKDAIERIKMENVQDNPQLLICRVSINDFFNENEFVEKPQELHGYEGYTCEDFDMNYFI